ncbi:MAG: hypothetical protein RR922_03460 [Clostridia bacterium]
MARRFYHQMYQVIGELNIAVVEKDISIEDLKRVMNELLDNGYNVKLQNTLDNKTIKNLYSILRENGLDIKNEEEIKEKYSFIYI